MGKGVEFLGKVNEAWFPTLYLEVIPGALAAPMVVALWAQLLVVGRHENGAARGDVCNDFVAGVTGVNHVRSFGVIGDHPTDFFAGADGK